MRTYDSVGRLVFFPEKNGKLKVFRRHSKEFDVVDKVILEYLKQSPLYEIFLNKKTYLLEMNVVEKIEDYEDDIEEFEFVEYDEEEPAERVVKILKGFTIDNYTSVTNNAVQTLREVIKRFSEKNNLFLQLFEEKTRTKSRKLVSKNKEELFPPTRKDLMEKYSEDMGNGYWLNKNYGVDKIKEFIEIACDIMDVKFGIDLVLIER